MRAWLPLARLLPGYAAPQPIQAQTAPSGDRLIRTCLDASPAAPAKRLPGDTEPDCATDLPPFDWTVVAMAETIGDCVSASGAITRADLVDAGFSDGDIAHLYDRAFAHATDTGRVRCGAAISSKVTPEEIAHVINP